MTDERMLSRLGQYEQSLSEYISFNMKPVSFYERNPFSGIGVVTQILPGNEPFHAFMGKKAITMWQKQSITYGFGTIPIEIYECVLSGNLCSGDWEEQGARTYTGDTLQVVRKVASGTASDLAWLGWSSFKQSEEL
jgi:hypothetical protein